MADSRIPFTPIVSLPVGIGSGTAGKEIRIRLNKDTLTLEQEIIVNVVQAGFTVAPASVDPGKFFSSIAIEDDSGNEVFASGLSLLEASKYTEDSSSVRSTLAAPESSCRFRFGIHHENDGAMHSLFTAKETADLSKYELVLIPAADNDNGFVGGTGGAAAAYDVRVNAKKMPGVSGLGGSMTRLSVAGDGSVVEVPNEHAGVATARHRQKEQVEKGTTTGEQTPVRIAGKNLTRFVQMITGDMTSGKFVRSDNIIKNIRLMVGDEVKKAGQFIDFQEENESKRGKVRIGSGVATIDFGDDERGWLDLSKVNEAFVEYDIDTAAPASWKVLFFVDSTHKL